MRDVMKFVRFNYWHKKNVKKMHRIVEFALVRFHSAEMVSCTTREIMRDRKLGSGDGIFFQNLQQFFLRIIRLYSTAPRRIIGIIRLGLENRLFDQPYTEGIF